MSSPSSICPSLISCRRGPMGWCFHATRQQAENKWRGVLNVLLNCMCLSFSLFSFRSLHFALLLSLPFASHRRLFALHVLCYFYKVFFFFGSLKHLFFVCGFDLNSKSWISCFCAVRIIDSLFCNLIFKWGNTHQHVQRRITSSLLC